MDYIYFSWNKFMCFKRWSLVCESWWYIIDGRTSSSKKVALKYSEIESIELITSRFKDTRGNELPICVPRKFRKYYLPEEKVFYAKRLKLYHPAYYNTYRKLDLTILKINLKNTNKYEGIILNLYKSKKRKQLIENLLSKINN